VTPDIYRILPEIVLTLTGILVMMIDAFLPTPASRRPLGWVAAFGVMGALWASLWQLSLPAGTAFYNTVQSDAFSIFFHVLICGIVIVALLLSLDALPANQHRNLFDLHLHPRRLPQTHRNQPGSRHQVLPARLLRHRLSALRSGPHLRRHRHHPDQ
jgi:hypothetical protein